MTLTELETTAPVLKGYTKNMPEDIRSRCTVRTHAAGSIIHQGNMELGYFGITAKGESRVISEFENESVYIIEGNKATGFIGEVTILVGMSHISVTIGAVTDNMVAYISRRDAEHWLASDVNILNLATRHTAFKLYRSSYNNGAKLFYPPSYLLLDYMVKYKRQNDMEPSRGMGSSRGMGASRIPTSVIVLRTRQMLQEEIGINIKTLSRTIRQLKEKGFFSICKGKIIFTREQYEAAIEQLEAGRDKQKKNQ